MKTLWTFGDSLTAGYTTEDKWAKDYIDWKGYKPKIFSEIIAEQLGIELMNLGKGGSDNDTIFETFCKNIKKIKENDIVLIGWSSLYRFRFGIEDKWKTIVPNFEDIKKIDDINSYSVSNDTIREILVNRSSPVYLNELNILIFFLEYICKDFKLLNWSSFENGRLNALYCGHCERIVTETNNEIVDNHFSEKGNIQLADYIIACLNGETKII